MPAALHVSHVFDAQKKLQDEQQCIKNVGQIDRRSSVPNLKPENMFVYGGTLQTVIRQPR